MATQTMTTTEKTGSMNPIMNVRVFWQVTGIAVAAVALLGIILNVVGQGDLLGSFLTFDWTHNIVHVALAGIALWLGYGNVAMNLSKTLAIVFGVVYLALGVVGFIDGEIFGIGEAIGLELELGENLVHLLIGAWGLVAGLMK